MFSFLHRKELPTFTFSLFKRFLFLGFIGYTCISLSWGFLNNWIKLLCIFYVLRIPHMCIYWLQYSWFYIDGFCRISMAQSFLFLGLTYSSPILVCAMGLLIPTFNFLLSLILRYPQKLSVTWLFIHLFISIILHICHVTGCIKRFMRYNFISNL